MVSRMSHIDDDRHSIELSVVVPVHNEEGNIIPLLGEIESALADGPPFEIIYVDDGSSDTTAAELARARETCAKLRILRHAERCGKTAATRTGVIAARGGVIVTLDGDGQNDPADIPKLLAHYGEQGPSLPLRMVTGDRQSRQDSFVRRVSSRVANGLRRRLLHDNMPDSACALKAFSREAFLALPYFDNMHRFLPALMQREGYEVRVVPVNHRPRLRGKSKYGVRNRLWVGVIDLLGVMWLQRRYRQAKTVWED